MTAGAASFDKLRMTADKLRMTAGIAFCSGRAGERARSVAHHTDMFSVMLSLSTHAVACRGVGA